MFWSEIGWAAFALGSDFVWNALVQYVDALANALVDFDIAIYY